MSSSSLSSLSGRVTSPKAGDQVVPGKDVMVVWDYASMSNEYLPETVDIELRDAATGYPVRTIVSKVPNRGYYFWNVDSRMPVGRGRCLFVGSLLRPSVPSVQSAPFDIVAPLASSQPVGGRVGKTNGISTAAATLAGNKRTAAAATEKTGTVRRRPKPAPWSCSSASSLSSLDEVDNAAQAIVNMSLDDTTDDGRGGGDAGGDSMPPLNRAAAAALRSASFTAKDAVATQHVTLRAKRRRDAFTAASATTAVASSSATSAATTTVSAGGKSTRQQQQRDQVQSTATFPWCDHPAFVYYTANMDTVTVRQSLRSVVKESDITADTMLESGETAGMFCVRYLLMHYYRKRVDSEDASVADSIRSNTYVPDPVLLQRYSSLLASKSLTAARRIPARAARTVSAVPEKDIISSRKSKSSDIIVAEQQRQKKAVPTTVVATAATTAVSANNANLVRHAAPHIVVPPTQITLAPLRLSAPQRRAGKMIQ